MKGLFVKDLCLMRELKKMVLIIIFISAIFTFSGTDSSFLTGYIVVLTSLLSGMTISYDEMNNGMAFLMTLPVTRKQYVKEKYLTGIVMILIGIVYSFAINMARILVSSEATNLNDLFITFMIFGVVGIIMLSFSIPVDLKFGAEKGRIMFFFGVMIVVFTIFLGLRFLEKYSPEKKEAVIQWINEALSGPMIYPACVICVIGVVGISYVIGCRIMEKKEF